MSENIPEKGAVIQKDLETYAIIPYIPGGLVDPDTLIKIANTAQKYHAKTLKVTSNQSIAIIGIKYDDIDRIWEDLDMKPGGFIGKKKLEPLKFAPEPPTANELNRIPSAWDLKSMKGSRE